jgi:hypothetical protein
MFYQARHVPPIERVQEVDLLGPWIAQRPSRQGLVKNRLPPSAAMHAPVRGGAFVDVPYRREPSSALQGSVRRSGGTQPGIWIQKFLHRADADAFGHGRVGRGECSQHPVGLFPSGKQVGITQIARGTSGVALSHAGPKQLAERNRRLAQAKEQLTAFAEESRFFGARIEQREAIGVGGEVLDKRVQHFTVSRQEALELHRLLNP